MFSVGDYVVHRNSGICKVKEIAPLPMAGGLEDTDYYFLTPINGKGSEIFSPVSDKNGNLRKVLSDAEAQELIESIPELTEEMIEDDKLRDARYKEAIRSCDCRELIKILKLLNARKQKRFAEGKKCTASEERYYKQAEENLCSELAFVLGKERDQMQHELELAIGLI